MSRDFNKDTKQEELDLFAQSLSIEEIPIPKELESRIRARIKKVKRQPKLFLKLGSVAAAIILLFIGGIKASPSFAGYMSNAPLIGSAVQWLKGDSGIVKASENGYKNLGPVVLTKDGITLTLDNIYFDEDRLRLSAVAEGERIKDKDIEKQKMESRQDKSQVAGTALQRIDSPTQPYIEITFPGFSATGSSVDSRGFNGKNLEITAEKVFKPGEVKKIIKDSSDAVIRMSIKVYRDKEWSTDFGTINIPFNKKDILMSKIYAQNERINVEHGVIYVDNLTISPTRIRLDVHCNMDDGYFFTSFENPELSDGEGNSYKPEGLVSLGWGGVTEIYFVPSVYFDKIPEKLYFSFSGIRIGTEENRTFTVGLSETLPKKLSYMEQEITLESVQYKEGELGVACTMNCGKLLTISGLELCEENHTVYSFETETGRHVNLAWFKSFFKVDKKDSYRLKYVSPGFLVNTPQRCELNFTQPE